jgi:hypothetical protein
MPGRNRMGPMGQGPLTGRGLGFCGGDANPSPSQPQQGPGFGRGRGRGWCRGWGGGVGWGGGGFGWRNWFHATGLPGWLRRGPLAPPSAASEQEQRQVLENQAAVLRNQLEAIESRLEDLKPDEPKETP